MTAQQRWTKKSFTPCRTAFKSGGDKRWLCHRIWPADCLAGPRQPSNHCQPYATRTEARVEFFLAERSNGEQGHFCFYSLHRSIATFFFFSTAQWTLCFRAASSGGLNSLSRPLRMVQCYWKTDSSCRQVENVQPLGYGRKAALFLENWSWYKMIPLGVFFFFRVYPAKTLRTLNRLHADL